MSVHELKKTSQPSGSLRQRNVYTNKTESMDTIGSTTHSNTLEAVSLFGDRYLKSHLQRVQRQSYVDFVGRTSGNGALSGTLRGLVHRKPLDFQLQTSVDPRQLDDFELDMRMDKVEKALEISNESNQDYLFLLQERDRLQAETARRQNAQSGTFGTEVLRIDDITVSLSPDLNGPIWKQIHERLYAETLDRDSAMSTVWGAGQVYRSVSAKTNGFRIVADQKNGKVYLKVGGNQFAQEFRTRIKPGRYAVHRLPAPSTESCMELARKVRWQSAIRPGVWARSTIALSVGGTVLNYAFDPEAEFVSTGFAVDLGLDLSKAAMSSVAGSAVSAGITSALVMGQTGALLGSWAPVIGTAAGFVIGIGIGVALEYLISDYRSALKGGG